MESTGQDAFKRGSTCLTCSFLTLRWEHTRQESASHMQSSEAGCLWFSLTWGLCACHPGLFLMTFVLSSPSKVSVPNISCYNRLPAKQTRPSRLPASCSPEPRSPGEFRRSTQKGMVLSNAEWNRGVLFPHDPWNRSLLRVEKREDDRITVRCFLDT